MNPDLETILVAIAAAYLLVSTLQWLTLRGILGALEELVFPSEDPIMTSSLPEFEYEEEAEEAAEEEEEVVETPEPEVFHYDIKEFPPIEDEEPTLEEEPAPVETPSKTSLRKHPKTELIEMAKERNLATEGTKDQIIRWLLDSY